MKKRWNIIWVCLMYLPILLHYGLLYLYYIRIRIFCKCNAYNLLEDWYQTKALPQNLKSTKYIDAVFPLLSLSFCLAVIGIIVGIIKGREKFLYICALALVIILWYVFVDPYFWHLIDS